MKGLCQKCFTSNLELVQLTPVPICGPCANPVKESCSCNGDVPDGMKCTSCGTEGCK
ncbi:MAG: hypothetical protein HOD60_08865 [Candidatus Nitrosopelagicus sp.]|jgi:hypothetical protein|nr:hypothetical protein [Candidatus Nitrosopelagicus sp.]